MNKHRNCLPITKPILIFCIILILFVLVSCGKDSDNKNAVNVNKINYVEKTLEEGNQNNFDQSVEYDIQEKEKIEKIVSDQNKNYEKRINENNYLDMKNTYYGKYNLNGEDILGNFEVARNSIVFTPDNGNSKEVIHFSGIKNIDRIDYPNGKIDLLLQYDGYEKIIKNVSDEMFGDVLLYIGK